MRDPLLELGLRDPVDRIAEIKAADPKRRLAIEFFDIWWAVHGGGLIKASDVADEVAMHVDDKSHRKADGTLQWSRQRVTSFLDKLVGTRLGGYAFSRIKDEFRTRATAHYKLQKGEQK